jgi:hypothetical protein
MTVVLIGVFWFILPVLTPQFETFEKSISPEPLTYESAKPTVLSVLKDAGDIVGKFTPLITAYFAFKTHAKSKKKKI